MSDDCKPATKNVRDGYAYDGYSETIDPFYELLFDRWLAEHDAEIRTATLEEAAAEVGRLREMIAEVIDYVEQSKIAFQYDDDWVHADDIKVILSKVGAL